MVWEIAFCFTISQSSLPSLSAPQIFTVSDKNLRRGKAWVRGYSLASFPGFPLAFISPAVEKSKIISLDFSTAGEIKARGKPGNEASYSLPRGCKCLPFCLSLGIVALVTFRGPLWWSR